MPIDPRLLADGDRPVGKIELLQPAANIRGGAFALGIGDIGNVVFATAAGAQAVSLADQSSALTAGPRTLMHTIQCTGNATALTITPGPTVQIDNAGVGVVFVATVDIIRFGLAAFMRANYPGRVTFVGGGGYSFASLVAVYGSIAAAGAAIAALCNATGTNEFYMQLGTNDWALWQAQYANAAAFRARVAAFWTAFRAATATTARAQTIGPRTDAGVPSTLGTVAQCRTAQAGGVTDSGAASVTVVDGSPAYSLNGSSDLLHPAQVEQTGTFSPFVRAAMGW